MCVCLLKCNVQWLLKLEATRDARAKVIAAEGEHKASRALKEAADVISMNPTALQLRTLQTLHAISEEKNSTIIFPLPMDMLTAYLPGLANEKGNANVHSGGHESVTQLASSAR